MSDSHVAESVDAAVAALLEGRCRVVSRRSGVLWDCAFDAGCRGMGAAASTWASLDLECDGVPFTMEAVARRNEAMPNSIAGRLCRIRVESPRGVDEKSVGYETYAAVMRLHDDAEAPSRKVPGFARRVTNAIGRLFRRQERR